MSDYKKLVDVLRRECRTIIRKESKCKRCKYRTSYGGCDEVRIGYDAADAIEELQALLGEAENSVERWKDMFLTKHEPKHGEWIRGDWNDSHILYRCSVCGNEMVTNQDYVKKHKYCFACGAKMDGEENEG